MWWVATAGAADMSFQCTDTATLPEHVIAWDEATAGGPVADARALADAWYDEACVTCTRETTWETCDATACVTAAGAVLDYHSAWGFDYRGAYDSTETTTSTLTVAPPTSAGLGWTALTVTTETTRISSSSSSGGDSTTTTASWVGELRADWPVDGTFTTRAWSDGSMWESNDGASWDDGTCAWRAEFAMDMVANRIHTVRMQDHTFDVVFSLPEGYGECLSDYSSAHVDGVFVGVPDEVDWTLLGTDADGDGWPVEHGDCDDADPATNPCAVDPWDGVDTDCDGAVEHDLDRDGADARADGGDDCDDLDATRHPGAVEIACDGVDQDCDDHDDRDGDDDDDACDTDCDDADAGRSSTTAEVPCDGVDQDCDGVDTCFAPDTGEEEEVDEEPPPADVPEDEDAGCAGGAAAGLLLLAPLGLARRRRRA